MPRTRKPRPRPTAFIARDLAAIDTPHLVPLSVVTDLLDSCVAVQIDGDEIAHPNPPILTPPGAFLAVDTPISSRHWWFPIAANATVEVRAAGFRLVDQCGHNHDVFPLIAAKLPGAPGPLTV